MRTNKTNITDYEFKYSSRSKYFPLWLLIKQQGKAIVRCPSIVEFSRIKKAISKQKDNDWQYKKYCIESFGDSHILVFSLDSKEKYLRVKLKNRTFKDHPFNLI